MMERTNDNPSHFDNIAKNYHEEINCHIRDHLINKWWSIVSGYFFERCKTIDIGCGDGSNSMFLLEKGIDVIGIDASRNLIERGIERHPQLKDKIFKGDAFKIPYNDNTFDIAIFIGVLHHIYTREKQEMAIDEALRVVKKGGIVIIRESNMRNPLFKLTWNYIFPLTSRIDRFGGENWIKDSFITERYKSFVNNSFYFTFLPHFTPKRLLNRLGKFEGWMENSFLRKLAAHYIIVLNKA